MRHVFRLALVAVCCGVWSGHDAIRAQDTSPAEAPPVADDAHLPTQDEMELPSAETLLRERPVDWIVLTTDEVLVVEPVTPRPDTLARMQAKIDEHNKRLKNVPPDQDSEWRARRERMNYVDVTLPDSDGEPWQLHRKYIREVIHHEDLVLRRVARLLDAEELRTAFELLLALERSRPDWPGLTDARHRLLFLEAETRADDGRWESALVFLEDLHDRAPKYAGLSEQLGRVVDALIAGAVEAGDFRRARHFLERLTRREPGHDVAQDWRDALRQRADGLLAESRTASAAGRHAEALTFAEEAARVWPQASGLSSVHQRAARRYPRLHVGVLNLPGEAAASPVPTAADRRAVALTQTSLFAVEFVDESPHYRSRLIESWTPQDLGRRVRFHLNPTRATWQSQPPLTAVALADVFRARLDPQHAQYDERLDSFVQSVAVESPYQFEVILRRVPLRTESLLTFPLSLPDDGTSPAAAWPFSLHEQTADRSAWRRSAAQGERLSQYHVAEIVEHKYASRDDAIRGLLRGEVSLLPTVRSRDVERLRRDGRFVVRPYGVPTTHFLQFNPRSRPLAHGELRRALALALDTRAVLDGTLLAGADPSVGRLTTAPWPRRSKVYDPRVAPRAFDPALAAALSAAARQRLNGSIPTLRLVCPPDPDIETAARELIRQWGKIGVTVELVPSSGPSDGNWDILYRTVRVTDPAAELWPLLTRRPSARIADLADLPDWLRAELLALESARDANEAEALLKRLHRHLWAETIILPLWEIDQFLIARQTVRGLPERPLHPYQHVERWTIEPWYPTDAL